MISHRKNTELVVTALQNLQEKRGATLKSITRYIMRRQNVHAATVRRLVRTALHKGLQVGTIERSTGGLYHLSEAFLDFARCRKRNRPKTKRLGRKKAKRKKTEKRDHSYDRIDKDEDETGIVETPSGAISSSHIRNSIYR